MTFPYGKTLSSFKSELGFGSRDTAVREGCYLDGWKQAVLLWSVLADRLPATAALYCACPGLEAGSLVSENLGSWHPEPSTLSKVICSVAAEGDSSAR